MAPGNTAAPSRQAMRILTVVLVAQALLLYGFSRSEAKPVKEPLAGLPANISSWQMVRETSIDKDTLDVLKADETLSRVYGEPGNPLGAHLFVAYFNSQRTGQAPHSPKNCLPGSGWVPSISEIITIPIEGRSPIEANYYMVSKGESRSVVLYWYQSRDRTVASEYKAKFYVAADAIRYNRSDTALVRVVVPAGEDQQQAYRTAIRFVQAIYPPLRHCFPA